MDGFAYHVAYADEPQRGLLRRFGAASGPWSAFVLNGRGRAFHTRAEGSFSVKWMAHGRARYEVDRRARTVSNQTVLLVDHQQPYEMEFDSARDGQSFCIFYAPELVAQAWASIEAGFDEAAPAGGLRAFPSVPFAPPPAMADLLRSLHAEGPETSHAALQARLMLLLGEAVGAAHGHRRLAVRTRAARPATRAHLLGLVERARAILDEVDGVGWSLAALADEVGVSRFHLLRLFKAVNGMTPIAYAESRRMAAAAARLRSASAPIGEVAAQFGYESPSAFAKAFRRSTGGSPTAWRT